MTKRTVSLAESVRVRGIPVAQGKGKGVVPERGGRIARKRVSKKRLTKGKLAWKIGYPKLEGDRATKERSLGRVKVKLRATRNIRDASGSRSRTCFKGGARLGEKFARADWRKLRVAFFFNEQQLNPKVGRKVVEQLFVRFRDRLANCELFAGISRVAVNKRWTKFIWDGDDTSFLFAKKTTIFQSSPTWWKPSNGFTKLASGAAPSSASSSLSVLRATLCADDTETK